jgi:hypothetical protein
LSFAQCLLELVLDIEAWKTFARCSYRKSDTYRHVFETVVSDCLEEGRVGGLDFTVDVSLRPTPALPPQLASKCCLRIASDGPLRRGD